MAFPFLVLFLKSNYQPDTATASAESVASTLLTISTHTSVTCFITIRSFRARRHLAKLLPLAEIHIYAGVIAILVESATPLATLGMISAIVQQLNASGAFPNSSEALSVSALLFQGLFISFCVSYRIRLFVHS